MPRKPRIEYNGAVYHVLNRGNYRQNLFSMNEWKTAEVFEKTLFECCEMKNWLLHAYCIMSNHYHLCIETPESNLCNGMQWLQSVFANRFNHFVQTPGHVFQGRYKALLVDCESNLLALVNYIHLNPVRAGLIEVSNLGDYVFSSLPKFTNNSRTKPMFLRCDKWLTHAGFNGRKNPMCDYLKLLEQKTLKESVPTSELEHEFNTGWCLGSEEFRKQALKRFTAEKSQSRSQLKPMGQDFWDLEIERCLGNLEKNHEDVVKDKKCASWKLNIALYLKYHLGAGNRYLSDKLNMGDLSNLSKQVNQLRRTDYTKTKIWKRITPNYQA